jgi:hypothetical protein
MGASCELVLRGAAADREFESPLLVVLARRTNQNAEYDREHAKGAIIQLVDVIEDSHADLISRHRRLPVHMRDRVLECRPKNADSALPLGTVMGGAG